MIIKHNTFIWIHLRILKSIHGTDTCVSCCWYKVAIFRETTYTYGILRQIVSLKERGNIGDIYFFLRIYYLDVDCVRAQHLGPAVPTHRDVYILLYHAMRRWTTGGLFENSSQLHQFSWGEFNNYQSSFLVHMVGNMVHGKSEKNRKYMGGLIASR